MGDLYSKNYYLTYKNLNFLNPLKYIYLFRKLSSKKKRNGIISQNFDRIILYSKNEIKKQLVINLKRKFIF